LTEIGAYLVVEPQNSVTLPLRYSLPTSVVRDIGEGYFNTVCWCRNNPGFPQNR
jgi:hypothetical protein